MAETNSLLNCRTGYTVPGVRIPHSLQKKTPLKGCFFCQIVEHFQLVIEFNFSKGNTAGKKVLTNASLYDEYPPSEVGIGKLDIQ